MPHKNHYTSTRHREWRAKVMKLAGYLCQECRKYGRTTPATHAHHLKPVEDYPELAYVVGNGYAVCDSCHNKIEPRRYRAVHRVPD